MNLQEVAIELEESKNEFDELRNEINQLKREIEDLKIQKDGIMKLLENSESEKISLDEMLIESMKMRIKINTQLLNANRELEKLKIR